MITTKIKALFQFIEFLHSNIDNFKQYDEVITDMNTLINNRKALKQKKNFQDKIKYDKIQAEIKEKFGTIRENITIPIQNKAEELNVCYFHSAPLISWNNIQSEIDQLKNNFSMDDVPEILQHKSKYIEFRTKTNNNYFEDALFGDLDEHLKELFDFFKETERNEFEAFEAKVLQVNNFEEALKMFKHGHKNFILSDILEIKQQSIIEPLPPQPIKTKAEILKEQLSQYGFFELEKVKVLSEQSKFSIIEKISESGLPYAIAMFDYLQFIQYLERKHFDSKYKLNQEVSKWFDSDKEGRAVKGNISSLLKNSTENKDRYTAYKHKENVIKDYELLK